MKITVARGEKPTSLYVEQIGDNINFGRHKPVTFVLPGGPGIDHRSYMRYACLQDATDIVFHDPRGCGKSDCGEPHTYTMDNYIDDVEAIREQFGFKKIIVLGKSYGAMCALGYALRYPQRVLKLILSAGAPSYRFLETAKENIRRLGTHEQIQVCEKLWSGTFTSHEELLHYFQLTNSLYSVSARAKPYEFNLEEKSKQFSYEVLNEGFRNAFWHFDFENQLSRIRCDTLILAGREDWINDVYYAEFMAKHIPHSSLKIFEQASHAMETDVTENYFGTIREFIKR